MWVYVPVCVTPRLSDLAQLGAGMGVGLAIHILIYLLHTRTHLHSWEKPAIPIHCRPTAVRSMQEQP